MTVPILARNHIFLYSDNGTNWITINGITQFTLTEENEVDDAGTFNSPWGGELRTEVRLVVELEGKYLSDPVTNERDAGQQLAEASCRVVGAQGLRWLRIETTEQQVGQPVGQPVGRIEGRGIFKNFRTSGEKTDLANWSVEFVYYGEPTFSGRWGAGS